MRWNKIMNKLKKITLLSITIFLAFSSCSSFKALKEGYELGANEGIVVLSFQFMSTLTVKGLSFDIIGNNETMEIDINHDDDNRIFTVMKKGVYQIENFKASGSVSGGISARDNTQYVSNKKMFFEVHPGVINNLGHVVIRNAYSEAGSNMIFRGKNNFAFLVFDIGYNQRTWDIFKSQYPLLVEKFKDKINQNFIAFARPKYERTTYFTRLAGLFRGRSGVSYKMTAERVKEVLKQERRKFDVVGIHEIVERGEENSIIKYVFSDNIEKIQWRNRLFKVIEIVKADKNSIIERLNKRNKTAGIDKWENNFEMISLISSGDTITIEYVSKEYLKR